ncbi:MAG TPA: cupredoxin domain-containing protein [Gaiellaceae bacterium]
MPLALSTGHEVGLAVTAGAFIAFALSSSFLFPRLRKEYPGGGLPAFIVVSFVFFFGMLAAVENFGAEGHAGERVAETTPAPATTTTATTTTTTSTQPGTPPVAPGATAATVNVSETEFKIALGSTSLKAGKITFDVKNDGKIPHDLAIKGMSQKTKLIQAGASATLTVTLKPGKYELYCSVPGHEAAGMKVNITVTSGAPATTPATTTAPSAAATTVQVTETEFKIAAGSTSLKAGAVTFDVKNGGKIPHDLAIKGMSQKTKLIAPGGSATLAVTLKPGTYELYCSVPGHEAAGMKLKVTVT